MGKRKREDKGKNKGKKGGTKKPRKGYSTVPRSRGVYAQGEMKYFDNNASTAIPASTDWTGTELDPTATGTLFVPVLGTGISNRIGKMVKVHTIRIKGVLTCSAQQNQTAGDSSSIARILVVRDQQTNATQAQGEEIMSSRGTAVLNTCSFQNIDNFSRFKVERDMTFILDNVNMSYDGTNIESSGLATKFKCNLKFNPPIEVRFNSTNGGTIADIVDNSWHVIATTNSSDLATALSYVSRVCYKD